MDLLWSVHHVAIERDKVKFNMDLTWSVNGIAIGDETLHTNCQMKFLC